MEADDIDRPIKALKGFRILLSAHLDIIDSLDSLKDTEVVSIKGFEIEGDENLLINQFDTGRKTCC